MRDGLFKRLTHRNFSQVSASLEVEATHPESGLFFRKGRGVSKIQELRAVIGVQKNYSQTI